MSETPIIERAESAGTGRSGGIGFGEWAESAGTGRSGEIGFGSVSGDTYAPTITTAGSRATRKGDDAGATVRGRNNPIRRGPHRAALSRSRLLVSAAREELSSAREEEDAILRSNAIDAARKSLAQLWSMRKQREEPFGDVINELQTYLDETPDEDLSNEQLVVLDNALERLADEQVVDDHVAAEITLLMLRGGANVFQDLG